MLHRCTDRACPSFDQRTSPSCGCHQTDEQVLRAEIERLRNILDDIGGLSRFLRQGGPAPMDLEGLSSGLSQAVDLANEAISEEAL